MEGLLDFIKTPAGQGLLSAAFGGLAGARRGRPLNSIGRAGVAGLLGYSQAQAAQERAQENELQNRLRQQQLAQMEAQQRAIDQMTSGLPEDKRLPAQAFPQQFAQSLFKEPVKPQLVTVAGPDGNPMQKWVRPGESTGVDVGPAPNKEGALPWYVRKDPSGKTMIDPAFAEFEKAKAASGRPVTPFFQAVPTEKGLMRFDARTGTFAPAMDSQGKPLVKSADSPTLQGQIAEAKKYGQEIGEQKSMLQGKEDALASVKQAGKMLEDGIYTGAYANLQLQGAKATPFVDKTKAARTEEFKSYIGNTVIPRLKEFGGNDSNEEMRYLQKVMGGEITMEEKALKKIVADAERKIQAGINRLKTNPDSTDDPLGLRK